MVITLDILTPTTHAPAGAGPLLVESASISRVLDGPGQITLNIPHTPAADALITPRARFNLYLHGRLLVAGVIRSVRRTGLSRRSLSVIAIDALEQLQSTSVLVARRYQFQPLAAVVQSLAAIANWQAIVAPTDAFIEARFDGVSVLKALQTIAKQQGWHLRLSTTPNSLEFGPFFNSSTLTLFNADSPLAADAPNAAYLRDITLEIDADNIINWLLPLGNGEGEAALTLENSTRPNIQTQTGPDGRLIYFLTDPASIAQYGIRQRVVNFKDIAPLNNSLSSKQNAANLLHDAALAYLADHAQPITRLTARLAPTTHHLLPGDRVRVSYSGPVRYLDDTDGFHTLDDIFSVVSITENYNQASAPTISLELATIPQPKHDPAAAIVHALETLEVRNLRPIAFPYWSENTYLDTIQNIALASSPPVAKNARFMLEIDNSVTDIHRVRLRVRTRPLYTMVIAQNPLISTNPANATSPHSHTIPAGFVMNMRGGVAEGSAYPAGLSILINNVDRTAELGGPWNPPPTNAPLDITLDITDYIRSAPGGIYQDHSIVFTCQSNATNTAIVGPSFTDTVAGSQGIVELNIRIQGTAMAIISQ